MIEGLGLMVVLALLASLGAVAMVAAGGPLSPKEKLSLDQVPAAVRETILREAAGHPLKEIERKTKDGATLYEAEWLVDDKEIEIKVDPEGKLLSRAVEEKVSLDEVPAAVRETILKESAGAPLKELERETKEGETLYEAEWLAGTTKIEIKVDSRGTVVRRKAKEVPAGRPASGSEADRRAGNVL